MSIDTTLLDTWPNAYPQRDFIITITQPEFTSVCPKTGLPDFGTLTIRYVPDELCIELKAFKYYLNQYRNEGIFYEKLVNQILDHLAAACNPRWMEISGDFTPRGGISTRVVSQICQPGFNVSTACPAVAAG